MHELSLANSLTERIEQHLPDGAVLKSVDVRAGAGLAVDPGAMQMAWRAATEGSPYQDAELKLICEPWNLHCPSCQRRWTSGNPLESCLCGQTHLQVQGENALMLVGLEIEEPQTCQEIRP